VEAARAEERAAYRDLCAARENGKARVATVRRTQAALGVARQTWEDACDASNQLKLIWERALFTPAGDAVGYYELHRKQSEAAFHRSLEVNRLGGRYEQCVQSLSDACVYMQRAAQRHAEALHALDRLEAGGSAGVVVVEPPVRFVPAADRAKQREKAIREAEMDQVAAAAGERAVLAELRAIGLCIGGPAVRTQLCL